MNHTFEEIKQAALSLPDDQRTKLIDSLNESLVHSDVVDAWVRLAVDRLEGVRSGVRTPVDGPSALQSMRERVRG